MINEKQYLLDLKQYMDEGLKHLKELDQEDLVDNETYDIIKKTIDTEDELRNKYEIGVRFNVLRSQLKGLFDEVSQSLHGNQLITDTHVDPNALDANSTLVYVLLFNAQGENLASWSKLLNSQALFEHSVNRPIYATSDDVEAIIRAKANKQQQAFIEIKINKNDILEAKGDSQFKDPLGHVLLRVKQGVLKVSNIRRFIHMNRSYAVKEDGTFTPIAE